MKCEIIEGRLVIYAQSVTEYYAAEGWRNGRDDVEVITAGRSFYDGPEPDSETEPEPASDIEAELAVAFDWQDPRRNNPMTATEVLVAIGYEGPNKGQSREASAALRKITQTTPRKSHGRQVFDMPNRSQVRGASAALRKLTGGEPQKHSQGKRVFWLPPRATRDEGPF
jgi:hypothetical protein